MNEKRYYTPNVEDLYIGYECEWTSCPGALRIEHEEKIRTGKMTSYELADTIRWISEGDKIEDLVRTKYLDRQDIESEGWKYGEDGIHYRKGDILLTLGPVVGIHQIERGVRIFRPGKDKGTYKMEFYVGECKSINELRKLQKWLGIE